MQITLIGAGNMATNLGKALWRAGHDIKEVYSRTMASAEALACKLGARATNDLASVESGADVYILAVKDSALEGVAGALARSGADGAVFLHTAGSVQMSVFEGYFKNYGVLYPMQTFSKEKEVEFSEIPFFVEGNNGQALHTSRTLAESISKRVYDCSSEQRRHLHLAAVFACNFVNHCYVLSARLLEKQGIPFDVMLPLIDETARKVHTLSPIEAQTGPAVRYDENIIQMQADLLSDQPALRELYLKMSENIHAATLNAQR